MDHDTLDWPDLPEISITDASLRLSAVADAACSRATYLTRRGRPVAALVNPEALARLVSDAEELADLRASDRALTNLPDEELIGWNEARLMMGLS